MQNWEMARKADGLNLPRINSIRPKVSVCIPSYNAARYIGETIRSVLDSSHSDLEIIVNDDASTDNTRSIVEGFGDERVRFFQNKSNLGPVKNWNCALERASGKFVGLLNHDDLYGPFWLSFVVHVLEKYPHIGWTATAYHVINDKGETLNLISHFTDTREYSRSEAFLCAAQLNGLGPGYIIRRKILEEVGYYDEDAGPSADNDLYLRLASKYPLYYSNYPHTAWRLHTDNLTHSWGTIEQAAEGFRILDKIFGDDALVSELREHKKFCYDYLYRKAIIKLQAQLEKGNLEVVQQINSLLYANGYGNGQQLPE